MTEACSQILRLALLLVVCPCLGCQSNAPQTPQLAALDWLHPVRLQDAIAPTNEKDWAVDHAVLPTVGLEGNRVSVHNVRDFLYPNKDDIVIRYDDRTYDLAQVRSVDFLVVPFKQAPSLAHTMLSFGFDNGDQLGVSVEARREKGEKYSPVLGGLRQFELIYVVADERDLISLRTQRYQDDVYLYPTVATPQQSRDFFRKVMARVDKLSREPEFYDTLTNNCTTNIVRHINQLGPGKIPYDVRVLMPGFSPQLAYDLGLLKTDRSFSETRRLAKISDRARRYREDPDFSDRIRTY